MNNQALLFSKIKHKALRRLLLYTTLCFAFLLLLFYCISLFARPFNIYITAFVALLFFYLVFGYGLFIRLQKQELERRIKIIRKKHGPINKELYALVKDKTKLDDERSQESLELRKKNDDIRKNLQLLVKEKMDQSFALDEEEIRLEKILEEYFHYKRTELTSIHLR